MNNSKRGKLVILRLILLVLIFFGSSKSPAAQEPIEIELMPGKEIILRHDDRLNPFYVARPEQAELGLQSANIKVNWNPATCSPPSYYPSASLVSWNTEAKSAFNYAVSIWAALLDSSQTIEVDACWWSTLGTGVLGSAGATDFALSSFHFNGPIAETWYPIALANALANTDLNGDDAEINANFSSTFDWYYGIDGNPGPKIDFASVVLHELGHGLGFLGSMTVAGSKGYWGAGTGYPEVYDRFTENGSNPLLSYPSGSTALAVALTSNNVYFDGSHANAANSGNRVKLYAPNPWQSGSSYAHLDEIFNNTPNALMTYSLANGEAEHSPGPVTLGIFQDMGWSVNAISAPDLQITQQVVGTNLQTGDPVTFNVTIKNIGNATATGVSMTYNLSSDIQWGSSTPNYSSNNGTSYVWNLSDLAPDASSYITINGVVQSDDTIVNTATVTANEAESNTINNTSSAIINGLEIYLPLILRND